MATNSTVDVGQQLEQLAAQLTEAVKVYKDALTTGNDFLPRINLIQTAQKIAFVTKRPDEQWLDQSVWVRTRPSSFILHDFAEGDKD
jgi:hypothetical protein